MKNLQNLEIINISTREGKLVALVSYQDTTRIGKDLNDGYDTIEIPINPRKIRNSHRGNMLVNQSKQISDKEKQLELDIKTKTKVFEMFKNGDDISVSLIQRKCSAGYLTASRTLEKLIEDGLVKKNKLL